MEGEAGIIVDQATVIHETFWLGFRHGRRIHEYAHHLCDHEPAMREELLLIGTTNRVHRAFALGELRGYRQAGQDIHGGPVRV